MIELLTVLAIIAILVTLLTSTLSATRARSREVTCQGQLRQIALGVEIYRDEAGRRPRSFTRLTTRPTWISNPKILLCPGDPALSTKSTHPLVQLAWGNVANSSQEPPPNYQVPPEEGSWESEIRVTTESIPFSYLHPLGWRKEAWQRLDALGNQTGLAVCQLHGIRIPNPGPRQFLAYEGNTLRAQRDGAVVVRKIFRTLSQDANTDSSDLPRSVRPLPVDANVTVRPSGADYPWEFYADYLPKTP